MVAMSEGTGTGIQEKSKWYIVKMNSPRLPDTITFSKS